MIDGKNGIQMTPAVCTQCGASLEVDPTQETAVCSHCGTPFIVSKAINNYNVQNAKVDHVDSINIMKASAVDSVVKFVDKQITKRTEEKRRLEEEARQQSEKKKAILKKYWWVFVVFFVGLFLLATLSNEGENLDSTGKLSTGFSSSELVGENYKEVVSKLEGIGFTNISTVSLEDLLIGWLNKDGEVEEVKIDGLTTFSSDTKFNADVEIIITFHTFPEQSVAPTTENSDLDTQVQSSTPSVNETITNSETTVSGNSVYDLAYILENKSYDIYYLFDLDTRTVINFSTAGFAIVSGTYTGDFIQGITIDYFDGLHEQVRYQDANDDSSMILTDSSGFEWTFLKTDVVEAERLIAQN